MKESSFIKNFPLAFMIIAVLGTAIIVYLWKDLGSVPRGNIQNNTEQNAYVLPEDVDILTFWILGPVAVQVIDPGGNVLTRQINQIRNASYDYAQDPLGFKMVTIKDPADGTYIVLFSGLEMGGTLNFATNFFGKIGDKKQETENIIKPGEWVGYTIELHKNSRHLPLGYISEPFRP